MFCLRCSNCNIHLHTECERVYRKYKGFKIDKGRCIQCNTETLVNVSNLDNSKNKKDAVYDELMSSFIKELDL